MTGSRLNLLPNSIPQIALLVFPVFFQSTYAQKKQNKATRFDTLQIRKGHPRIWIDANKTSWLKEKCKERGMTSLEVYNLLQIKPFLAKGEYMYSPKYLILSLITPEVVRVFTGKEFKIMEIKDLRVWEGKTPVLEEK